MPIKVKKSSSFVSGQGIRVKNTAGGRISFKASAGVINDPVFAVYQSFFGAPAQIIKFQNGVFTTTSQLLDPFENPTTDAYVTDATNRLGVGVLGGSYWGGGTETACVWFVSGPNGICGAPLVLVPFADIEYSYVWRVFARSPDEIIVVSFQKPLGDPEHVQTWKIDLLTEAYTLLDSTPIADVYQGAFMALNGDMFLYGRTIAPRGNPYDAVIKKLGTDDTYTYLTYSMPAVAGSSEVSSMTQLPGGNLIALGLFDAAEGPFTSILWEFDSSGTALSYKDSSEYLSPYANKGWVGSIPVDNDTLATFSETGLDPGGRIDILERGLGPTSWSTYSGLTNVLFSYTSGMGNSGHTQRFDGNYAFIKATGTSQYYLQLLSVSSKSFTMNTMTTSNGFSSSDHQLQMTMPDGGVALFGWDVSIGAAISVVYLNPADNTTSYTVSPYAFFSDGGFDTPQIVSWRPGNDLGGRPYTP